MEGEGKYSQHARNNFAKSNSLRKIQVSSAAAVAITNVLASDFAEELRTEIELGDLKLKALRNSEKVVI